MKHVRMTRNIETSKGALISGALVKFSDREADAMIAAGAAVAAELSKAQEPTPDKQGKGKVSQGLQDARKAAKAKAEAAKAKPVTTTKPPGGNDGDGDK